MRFICIPMVYIDEQVLQTPYNSVILLSMVHGFLFLTTQTYNAK